MTEENTTWPGLGLLVQNTLVCQVDVRECLLGWILAHSNQSPADGRLYLSGREPAIQLLERIKAELGGFRPESILLIRFDQVCCTADFVEELAFALFCPNGPAFRLTRGKAVLLVNPDEGTRLAAHRALAAWKRACLELDASVTPCRLCYLGAPERHFAETLECVRNGCGTSREVAERLGIPEQYACRRLKYLHDNGMVRRQPGTNDNGRLAYGYSFFHPQLITDPATPLELLSCKAFAQRKQRGAKRETNPVGHDAGVHG